MAFWRPPGASLAAGEAEEGALGGKGGVVVALFLTVQKLVFDVFRPPEDVKTRILPPPSPRGVPGRLGEVIFGGFLEVL